ncbi:SGNH/GDSL hydrolase family protein [Hyalangium versicolor]|uniref:SGNH/GDSL hydrolase family protein n=1 Tax=Hyalangium versicolor TaxID=2861190 RepID=UPI001CCBFFDF|nr:SGNH/GDSL hydrolase family protein [Hyalangium versicolor]
MRNQPPSSGWYASWAAAQQDYNEPFPAPPPPLSFNNHTVRQILHISIGGEQVRVRFSNLFGKSSLKIDGAHIARSAGGASIAPGTDTELKFSGSTSAEVAPGSELWSDAAALEVKPEDNLAVSVFLASETPVATVHSIALQTQYVVSGNALSAENLAQPEERASYYFVSGLDVQRSAQARVVVALGDSITDGVGTTPNTNHRWPDILSRRLQADGSVGTVSVVNAGIAGGRILTDAIGPKGVGRFDRDVLGQSGVSHVVFVLGINDIGFPAFVPDQVVTVEQMTAGVQSMIDKAKARGVKVLVGTLLPFKNAQAVGRPYYLPEFEAKRQAYNAWVRSNPGIDAVIDFDKALQDPADPLALLPAYDSGDHLHPSDKGAEAIANAVELSLFKVAP